MGATRRRVPAQLGREAGLCGHIAGLWSKQTGGQHEPQGWTLELLHTLGVARLQVSTCVLVCGLAGATGSLCV